MSEDWDDYDDTMDCWECGGDGGWNSCMADCCPAVGGEDGCTDRNCWRVCPNCRGTGSLPTGNEIAQGEAPSGARLAGLAQDALNTLEGEDNE